MRTQGHRQGFSEIKIESISNMAHKKAGGSTKNGRDSESKKAWC